MKKWLFFIPVLILASCSPVTKVAYLRDYDRFISNIRDHNTNPGFDWGAADKQFTLFTKKWYERFKDQLSFSEKIRCKRYFAYYMIVRHTDNAKTLAAGVIEDIRFLRDQPTDLGGFALDALDDGLNR